MRSAGTRPAAARSSRWRRVRRRLDPRASFEAHASPGTSDEGRSQLPEGVPCAAPAACRSRDRRLRSEAPPRSGRLEGRADRSGSGRDFQVMSFMASPRPRATGVHCTRSMRGAPVASITSRSKPSATPLAWRHCRRAPPENPRRAGSARRGSRCLLVHFGGEAAALLAPRRSVRRSRWRARRRRHRARSARRRAGRAGWRRASAASATGYSSRMVGRPRPSMRLDLLDQDAAEDVRPGVVRGDPDSCAHRPRREASAVGGRRGEGGEKVDAGMAARKPRRRSAARPARTGSALAAATGEGRRAGGFGRRGDERERYRPSPPRRARRRGTIRAW